MKNKLSRFAVPYEVWMAIFVVAPILIMVIYAFSSAEGGFTLDNFVQMGGYTQVFLRSFKLAIIATLICLVIGYPVSYLMSREGADHASYVDELPAADVFLDDYPGKPRPAEPAVSENRAYQPV